MLSVGGRMQRSIQRSALKTVKKGAQNQKSLRSARVGSTLKTKTQDLLRKGVLIRARAEQTFHSVAFHNALCAHSESNY